MIMKTILRLKPRVSLAEMESTFVMPGFMAGIHPF
jgi:hypothetical protein